MTDEKECCVNCRFWDFIAKSSNSGRCRRYPPQFWSEGEESGASFVGTEGSDWCGEHQPKYRCIGPKSSKLNEPGAL